MRNYGRSSVYDFLGELIVYRKLEPVDSRLPDLDAVSKQLSVPGGVIPRKTGPEYARIVSFLLQEARKLEAPKAAIKRLLYLGDTQMNDGTAFRNVCRAGGWRGLAFIASERDNPRSAEVVQDEDTSLYLAEQWAALADFRHYLKKQNFPVDEHTAVIVDLDKTALGARGRNDHVIDMVRVEAARKTVDALLGDGYDPALFQKAYSSLNQTRFHPFTTDNQDYLAYCCLAVSAGLIDFESLLLELEEKPDKTFYEFLYEVDRRSGGMSPQMRDIHNEFCELVREGDPTPFKVFRQNEYLATVKRMGCLDDQAQISEMLREEVVITQEVRETALTWREGGALLFGLSDKPDEASLPTEKLKAEGYRPIHQTHTHIIGG